MKRLTFTTLMLLLIGFSAMAQSYSLVEFDPIEINPRNFNIDQEQTWPYMEANYTGYDSINAGGSPQWSSVQTLPFSFSFNGTSVSQYYVSNTGVLTFSSSPGTAPSALNAILPSPSIPDMSVMAWGLNLSGGNDAAIVKTFGTAPNRQHWVIYASASESGISGGWTYWGIVLEETTNNIYVVDMRTYGGNTSLTVGVQIDAVTAVAALASPNVASVNTATGGNGDLPDDNKIYGFITTQDDVALYSTEVGGVSSDQGNSVVNMGHNVEGRIVNYGANAITTFDVEYQLDGGSAMSYTANGVNIAPGTTHDFTHGTAWTPTAAGNLVDFDIEVVSVNGNTDPVMFDNSDSKVLFVNLGITGTTYVLFEEYSTAPCGYCPDGLLVIEDMLLTLNNVNYAQIHAGFGTDSMTIPEHVQWAAAFTNAAPKAQVDRIYYEGEETVAISRSLWKQRAQAQLNEGVPVNIILEGNYDENTRTLDLDVKAEFKDYAIPADYRLNVYIIEDPVVGSGPGYDQANYYSSQYSGGGLPGHPYYAEPHPIPGYEHRFVIRSVPSATWGTSGVIPQAPQPNQTYEHSYTTTLHSSWDESEIYVIAYVSQYDNDPNKRPVMNSYQEHLDAFRNIGINAPKVEADIEVYPNPATDFAQVSLDLEKTSDVTVEVVNAVGQRHTAFAHSATFAAGKQYVTLPTYEWGAGVYLVNIRIDGVNSVKQLVVTR